MVSAGFRIEHPEAPNPDIFGLSFLRLPQPTYTPSDFLIRRDKLHVKGSCCGGGDLTVKLDIAAFRHSTAGNPERVEAESFAVVRPESYSYHRVRLGFICNGQKQAIKARDIKLSDLTRLWPPDLMQDRKTVAFGQN